EALPIVRVVEGAADAFSQHPRGGLGRGLQEAKAEAERITGQRQHPAELARPQNAHHHDGCPSCGSGWSSTAWVCAARYRCRAARYWPCLLARIAVARSAALTAPARPMAMVPTGT